MKIRKQKKQRAKKKIFSKAIKLFNKKGFDKTTVSKIADAAGVSRGSFFNYYAHKEAVLVDYLAQYLGDLERDVAAKCSKKPPLEAIYFIVDNFAIFAQENRHLVIPLCFELLNPDSERSKHAYLSLPLVPLIKKYLEYARADLNIRQDYSSERLARTIANTIFLNSLNWVSYRQDSSIRDELKIALDLCLQGMLLK